MDFYKEISKVAYELYEKKGKAEGRHLDDWLVAEGRRYNSTIQRRRRRKLQSSFFI